MGRIAGPFDQRPLPILRVSPIGLVPKKEPNEFRLIHHLSYPLGSSVNDYTDRQHCSVQYCNVWNLLVLFENVPGSIGRPRGIKHYKGSFQIKFCGEEWTNKSVFLQLGFYLFLT